MPQPYNYRLGGQDPGVTFFNAFEAGKAEQAALEEKQKAERAALNARIQQQGDINNLMSDPSPKGFAEYTLKYPKEREAVKQVFDQLDQGRRQDMLATSTQIYSTLLAGRNDLAKNVINEKITALQNSGAPQADVDSLKAMDMLIDADPKLAAASVGRFLSSVSDPQKFAENFGKIEDERRKREAESLGKTADELKIEQQRAELEKTRAETKKLVDEAAAAGKLDKARDPDKYVKVTTALSDEYRKSVKGVPEMATAYEQLKALYDVAKKDPSGASDIPFLTQFMKTLDPGSVVRETEFATAAGAGGLYERLVNVVDSATKGTKITAAVRDKYMESAKALFEAAKKSDRVAKTRVGTLATKVGVDPNDVFSALPGEQKYTVGQIIDLPDGRKARVTGGDMNDPDVELVQ